MNIDWAQMADGTAKVIVAGLIFGAGLPLLYTLGIRLWDTGSDAAPAEDGTVTVNAGKHLSRWTAYAIFAVVIAAVIIGVLYITQKSIDHYLGIELF